MDATDITTIVGTANNNITDNSIPTFAMGMSLFGGLSSTDFWGLIQNDLQRKNLLVNASNLQVNYSNNFLMRENLALAKESASQLYSINNQLNQLNEIIAKKASQEERENFARELIYNIKKMDSALAVNNDKSFVSFEAKSLIFLIDSNHISTASFTQIQDKEYFEGILNSLKQKSEDITPEEQKDLEGFVSIYTYCLSLIDEYKAERHLKVINVPENFDFIKEKPQIDPILDCQREFEDEIDNEYTYIGMFSNNLRNYIYLTEQLPDFFENFFKVKKEYIFNYLKWSIYYDCMKAYTNQDRISDLDTKIQCCFTLIDKFLEMHPDLTKDYPKLTFDMAMETIDFNKITKEFEQKYQTEEKELNNYYESIKNRLNNRKSSIVPSKKKKRFFSFFK